MTTVERRNLVAPCGIDCGLCELHMCQGNPQLMAYLVSKGVSSSGKGWLSFLNNRLKSSRDISKGK